MNASDVEDDERLIERRRRIGTLVPRTVLGTKMNTGGLTWKLMVTKCNATNVL